MIKKHGEHGSVSDTAYLLGMVHYLEEEVKALKEQIQFEIDDTDGNIFRNYGGTSVD